ncbi:MAG TPA: BCCT family transporter, partial [Modicisalibacter sp.]|nr:BCCT family transporter [Modicisalibacter sp.]
MPEPNKPEKSSWLAGVDVPVTIIAAALTIAFLVAAIIFTDQVRVSGLHIFNFITAKFGWVFVLGTAGFVFLCFYLAFGRYGNVKLGSPDDKPAYSAFSWIAMMFALGVGIGLIFYGAYEPVLLYAEPPPGGPEPYTVGAAVTAMQYSIFHWALHPWAFFGIAGLAFAYTNMNKGRPALVSGTLRPLLGRYSQGNSGRAIDIWVIVTTLVGNAVTLGLGTLQIVAGLGYVAGLESSDLLLIIVVGTLTLGFIYSALAGVDSGIKRLADFNTLLAIALLLFVFILGPIGFILELLLEVMGGYLFNFLPMAFQTGAFIESMWMQNWTIFFWAWGISWAPYVGSFLAQISRGRTIREYVIGVMIAPSI